MENVNKIEIMLIAAPVVVYWFYVLFLLLTELSPHKGIEISRSRKITVTSIVLVPLALLWGLGVFDAKAVDIEATLGAFFAPLVDYVMVVWMLCAPIALLYSIVLILKNANVLFPASSPRKYRVNSTEDCVLALNATTGFIRKHISEKVQDENDRENDEKEREFWDAHERRIASDEAEGIYT